jgi:hypothetical protein
VNANEEVFFFFPPWKLEDVTMAVGQQLNFDCTAFFPVVLLSLLQLCTHFEHS